jgi:hypothetical protein
LSYGVVDRQAASGRQTLRKGFGFLRECDHGDSLAQREEKAERRRVNAPALTATRPSNPR